MPSERVNSHMIPEDGSITLQESGCCESLFVSVGGGGRGMEGSRYYRLALRSCVCVVLVPGHLHSSPQTSLFEVGWGVG